MIYDTGGNEIVQHAAFFEDLGISLGQHNPNTFRMTSYFELVGFNSAFVQSRKEYIIEAVRKHVKGFDKLKLVEEGVGFRPCAIALKLSANIPSSSLRRICSGRSNSPAAIRRVPATSCPIGRAITRAMARQIKIDTRHAASAVRRISRCNRRSGASALSSELARINRPVWALAG